MITRLTDYTDRLPRTQTILNHTQYPDRKYIDSHRHLNIGLTHSYLMNQEMERPIHIAKLQLDSPVAFQYLVYHYSAYPRKHMEYLSCQ